jgi:flagellar hook-length control protein FliK
MIAQEPTTPAPIFATKLDGLSVAPLPTPEPTTAITDPQAKSDYPSHPMTEVFTADASLPKNVSNIAQTAETFTNSLPIFSPDTIPQQSPAPAAALRPDLLELLLPSATPTPLRAALADQLILLVQSPPQGSVTLTLAPEDLGTLRFDVQYVADSISVHLTVERPETLDLLRRHADHLAEAFRQAGFSGASFTFGGGDGGQRDRPPTPSTPQWSETAPPMAERHMVGLLDMRL